MNTDNLKQGSDIIVELYKEYLKRKSNNELLVEIMKAISAAVVLYNFFKMILG